MSDEVIGFISDKMNTTKMFENMLGTISDKNKETKQVAVYANQWRFW